MRKPKQNVSQSKIRDDGRRQLLIYLDPDVIRDLKTASLADPERRPAYELAEEAIRQWLKRRKSPRS